MLAEQQTPSRMEASTCKWPCCAARCRADLPERKVVLRRTSGCRTSVLAVLTVSPSMTSARNWDSRWFALKHVRKRFACRVGWDPLQIGPHGAMCGLTCDVERLLE